MSCSAIQCVEPMDLDDMHNDGNEVVDHALIMHQYEVQAKAGAMGFLLNLHSLHGLSQSAINDVQLSTNRLIQTDINFTKKC